MKNFLSKLSFKTKLIGLCLFLSSVSVVIGAISFNGLHQMETSYDQVTDDVMPNLNTLNNMFLSYRSVRIHLRTLGLTGLSKIEADKAVVETLESIEHYEKFNQTYAALSLSTEEKKLYDVLQTRWLSFKEIGNRALALHKSGTPEDHEKLIKIFLDDCPKAAKEYTAAIDEIKVAQEADAIKFTKDARASASHANQLILFTASIGILIGLSLGVLFATSLFKAISQITHSLSENALHVTTSSTQIAAASGELSQAATEQAASLEQTAAALEEITAMISKASDNANTTAKSSNDSQAKAEEGREAVEEMLNSMNEISQSNDEIMSQITQSNNQLTEVVKLIQDIGNKTKVINEIVFQTKLLSFNASVEAARAGEHGKGFAVVAEEVGNLAQMSGNAAKEISDMLNSSIPKVEGIVSETKRLVEGLIAKARSKVDSGVQVAQKCSQTLNEIVNNINRVSGLALEISSAGKEQSQGVSEINKAISQLDLVTQQNSGTSEHAASSAHDLAEEALSLKHTVELLAQIVNGASSASVEVKDHVAEIKTKAPLKKKTMALKSKTVADHVPNSDDEGFVAA